MAPPIKVSNWMQALSDFMIAFPEAKSRDAAAYFGRTESWVSTVKTSDAFKTFHGMRRELHFDRISEDVADKLNTLSEMTLDRAIDRVEEQGDTMPMSVLLDTGKMALNAMGFGGRGNGVSVNINQNDNRSVVINDANALARSRERMKAERALNDQRIIEGRVEQFGESVAENAQLENLETVPAAPVMTEPQHIPVPIALPAVAIA